MREISRKISLAPLSVKRYLRELLKEKLIIEEKHRIHGYPVYYANRDNDYFKVLKRVDTILSIEESGLLDHLYDECFPKGIVLFGSSLRGEDFRESDIDIFLLCKEKKLDLESYEKTLSRSIQIHFAQDIKELPKELMNNILNGYVMKGYIKVF